MSPEQHLYAIPRIRKAAAVQPAARIGVNGKPQTRKAKYIVDYRRLAELYNAGTTSYDEISEQIGYPTWLVNRSLTEARKMGLIEKRAIPARKPKKQPRIRALHPHVQRDWPASTPVKHS